MKKMLSIMLCAIMLISVITTAYTADTKEAEAILQSVKTRIGSTEDYDNFDIESYDDSHCFTWTSDDEYLSVSADSDGTITFYVHREYGSGDTDSIPISQIPSKADLQTSAERIFAQLNPDIAANFKVDSISINRANVDVTMSEYKNGYRVKDSECYLSLDLTGNKLLRMSIMNKPDAKFENGKVISKEDAIKHFKEKLGLELYYNVEHNRKQDSSYETVITPLYRLKKPNSYINAINGDVYWIKPLNEIYTENADKETFELSMSAADAAGGSSFTDAEIFEFQKTENLISKEKAFEIFKNIRCADIPDISMDQTNASLLSNTMAQRKEYIFSYYKDDGENISVTELFGKINAANGDVIEFHSYSYNKNHSEKAKISAENAAKIANQALTELAPEKSKEYKLYDSDNTNGCFKYGRYVNGIPVDNDGIMVEIDMESGKVIGWCLEYTEGDFSDISNVISKDEAENVFFKNVEYNVMYIYDSENEKYMLCYITSDTSVKINPVSGEFNSKSFGTAEEYTDIFGHYCEQAASALLESSIGFDSTELQPDTPIKQKEFALLLQDVVKNENHCIISDNYDYDRMYGYIDFIGEESKQPENMVTRLDAARFTAAAIGYGDLSQLNIFKPMFTDIGEENGFVSILAGLNIMSGDENGNFNPDETLTRGQALIIIYNYLNR